MIKAIVKILTFSFTKETGWIQFAVDREERSQTSGISRWPEKPVRRGQREPAQQANGLYTLAFEIDEICKHLIRYGNNFRIGLEPSLGGDHLDELVGNIDV